MLVTKLVGAAALVASVSASSHKSSSKHSSSKHDSKSSSKSTKAQTVALEADQPKFNYGSPSSYYPGVRSTDSNGPTNPNAPSLGTPINQESMARLASINSINDWCTFGPPGKDQPLADVEATTVAWCTQPRNNARVIPDGTVTGAHFVKTPLYLQVMASGDFTKIGVQAGDEGGELDPHGATNMGNPVGGNVTSNISGQDVFYEEWMNYIAHDQMCFRVCIAGSDAAPTAAECQHTLDVMGCNFVMPGNYDDNVFDTCDGDSAYPPGLYPMADGSTSTFVQYFTGTYMVGTSTVSYTNGSPDQVTPTAAYSMPATSNCVTTSTIYNGIKSLAVKGADDGDLPKPTFASYAASASSASKSSSSSSASSASSTASLTKSVKSSSTAASTSLSAQVVVVTVSASSSSGNSGTLGNLSGSSTSAASQASAAISMVLAATCVLAGAMLL